MTSLLFADYIYKFLMGSFFLLKSPLEHVLNVDYEASQDDYLD